MNSTTTGPDFILDFMQPVGGAGAGAGGKPGGAGGAGGVATEQGRAGGAGAATEQGRAEGEGVIHVSDDAFLSTIFGDQFFRAHVTGFADDPSSIAPDRRGMCWSGTAYARANGELRGEGFNTYFCVSLFSTENGRAVRRKRNFQSMHCLVLDDVHEKIPQAQACLLPEPTWRLETSPGNEQWGYVLVVPETDRRRAENLSDGLIANGLAPDGTDPGMRGVTRYVRLPSGWNTKSKLGSPWKCRMLEWAPQRKVMIEEIAGPFGVDLNARRPGEDAQAGAEHREHPVLDKVRIIEDRGNGEFLIECPWIEEHTDRDDSGTWLITRADGSIGFECHHGHCQGRTGKEFLDELGVRDELDVWRAFREAPPAPPRQTRQPDAAAPSQQAPQAPTFNQNPWEQSIDDLPPDPTMDMAALRELIGRIALLPQLEQGVAMESLSRRCKGFVSRKFLEGELRDVQGRMRLERARNQGDMNVAHSEEFARLCREWCYVGSIDCFVNPETMQIYPVKSFQNMYMHVENEIQEFSEATGQPVQSSVTRAALSGPMGKLDGIDYAPGEPRRFVDKGLSYLNIWNHHIEGGTPGDVRLWLHHFDVLRIRDREREHMLDWMAFTLQRPEIKINHILMLGGAEGIGKDYLMYPMVKALDEHSTTIQGGELAADFNEFLFRTKHLHINELEAGNRSEKVKLTAHLKPLAAAPPERVNINRKGISVVPIRNIVNVSAATNDEVPLNLQAGARRYYMVWSDATIRGVDGQITDKWLRYWDACWTWMRDNGGWRHCLHLLMNRDLSRFDPRAVPQVTDHQKEVVEANRSPLESYIHDCLETGYGVFGFDLLTSNFVYRQMRLDEKEVLGQYGMYRLPDVGTIGRTLSRVLGRKPWHKKYRDAKTQKIINIKFFVLENGEKYLAKKSQEIHQEIFRLSELIADLPKS